MKDFDSLNKKKVNFSHCAIIYHYKSYTPCLQEYINEWNECKKAHLRNQYMIKYGSLVGFDLDRESKNSEKEDHRIEKNLFRNINFM